MNNYLIFPECADIRAARSRLNMKQQEFADKCGINMITLSNIELEKNQPSKKVLEKITTAFAEEGIYFLPGGGFRVEKNIVSIYEGEDSFLKVQDDILRTCGENKEEVLYLGADDSKSNKEITAKEKDIYAAGIPSKNLIALDSDFILGPSENYRKISKNYFLCDDVIVIYGTKVCFSINVTKKPYSFKVVKIDDSALSDKFKQYFYSLWEKAKKI